MAETDLTKMTPAELVEAIKKDNSLASEFDRLNLWGKFYPWDWDNLLSAQPQLVDKCAEYKGWDAFDPWNWCILLKAQPQFADKCTEYNGWEKFNSSDWSYLLKAQPQLWIYCPQESVNKIKEDPTKAKECKCWDWIDSENWSHLLSSQPQFANKCNWSKMRANNYDKYDEDEYEDFEDWKAECGEDYSKDWKNLLLKQPQLAEYFTDALWDGFSQKQWAELEAKYPGVFEDKHMLSTLRKLAK